MENKLVITHLAIALDELANARMLHEHLIEKAQNDETELPLEIMESLSDGFRIIERRAAELLSVLTIVSYGLSSIGFTVSSSSEVEELIKELIKRREGDGKEAPSFDASYA